MRRLPLLPALALSAAMLGEEAGAQQYPEDRGAMINRIVGAADDSYAKLAALLGHTDAGVRGRAHARTLAKAVHEVDESRKPFAHKTILNPANAVSVEQRRRLEAILSAIEDAERNLKLKHGTPFRAPDAWNAKGHTVRIEEALRTIAESTGQRMNMTHLPAGIALQEVRTNGLDGMLFWSAFRALGARAENAPAVTVNSKGALWINQQYSHGGSSYNAVSGPLSAEMVQHDSYPHKATIRLDSEPRLQLDSCRVISVVVVRDGKPSPHAAIDAPPFEKSMSLMLPRAARQGEKATVIVRCSITAHTGETRRMPVPKKDVLVPARGYSILIRPNEPVPGNRTWTNIELRAGTDGFPPSVENRFDYLVLDAAGDVIPPECQPHGDRAKPRRRFQVRPERCGQLRYLHPRTRRRVR
jgi:hypothetical protein